MVTLSIQGIITLLAAAISYLAADMKAGLSALSGGGIHCVATILFAMRYFALRPGSTPAQMLSAFAIAELIKMATTVVLLMLALQLPMLSPPPLIITFIAVALLSHWLALLLTASR